MAAAGKEKMLQLRSGDDEFFEVEESAAMESETIKNLTEECADGVIPLPNVSAKILVMVIQFCREHAKARAADAKDDGEASSKSKPKKISADELKASDAEDDGEASKSKPKKTSADELKAFDAEFVKVDKPTLFDLIMAANYLHIEALLDLTCQTVADMIKGKTPEEIRAAFNIKNDFTKDEEAEVMRENQWAFE